MAYPPTRPLATDLPARAAIVVLFAAMCVNLFGEFLRTGHLTGLLLLASESLVVILTVVRRQAQTVDRSTAAAIVTAISVAGPPLLRASGTPALVPDEITAAMSAIGLMLVVTAKLTLGRSFGLVPANRGVVAGGPYAAVRHPIYAGYLITHAAFLLGHPTLLNITVLAVADGALVVRALMEERVLSTDDAYRLYCRRVGWHMVPGVF